MLLPEKPAGFGSPIADRKAWEKLAGNDSFQRIIPEAERLLQSPIPEQPDDLYLDFSRTGNRIRWQRISGRRRGRVRTFTLAECLENKGRFIPAFEEIVQVLCSERTWGMPAHQIRPLLTDDTECVSLLKFQRTCPRFSPIEHLCRLRDTKTLN
jgi:hypothetical protein